MSGKDGFAIESSRDGDSAYVRVSGEIDMQSEPALTEAIRAALASGAKRLVIDLQAVRFIDSSGLRALLLGAEAARRSGIGFALAVTPGPVTRLLSITGLDSTFEIV